MSNAHELMGWTNADLRICGVTTVVPPREVGNSEIDGAEAASKVTGVMKRRWVSHLSDQKAMEVRAASELMSSLSWDPKSVTVLIHVTQTPQLNVPASAYELHHTLGLSTHCAVVPVNWSCAGYVMGLWLANSFTQDSFGTRVLLVVGDSTSAICEQGDRATQPLFGDAVSATALTRRTIPYSPGLQEFILGSDGNGAAHLRMEPYNYLRMDGPEVLNFVLSAAPRLARGLLNKPTDFVLMHQANKIMIDALRRKFCAEFRLTPEQVPSNIAEFGNCSSASIPLLMTSTFGEYRGRDLVLAMMGFGAGWAWAGARLELPAEAFVKGYEL